MLTDIPSCGLVFHMEHLIKFIVSLRYPIFLILWAMATGYFLGNALTGFMVGVWFITSLNLVMLWFKVGKK